MGQPITVTVRPGVRSDVKHFELNRSLTGMQTHRYQAGEAIPGVKPPDELARRLFALGVSAVTIYSSVVTVVAPTEQWSSLQAQVEDTITNLFIHYRDGQPPAAVPVESAPAAEATTEPAGETTEPTGETTEPTGETTEPAEISG
jgi:hypothetical protein